MCPHEPEAREKVAGGATTGYEATNPPHAAAPRREREKHLMAVWHSSPSRALPGRSA
jgi:hypothetical protein